MQRCHLVYLMITDVSCLNMRYFGSSKPYSDAPVISSDNEASTMTNFLPTIAGFQSSHPSIKSSMHNFTQPQCNVFTETVPDLRRRKGGGPLVQVVDPNHLHQSEAAVLPPHTSSNLAQQSGRPCHSHGPSAATVMAHFQPSDDRYVERFP